MVPVNLLFLVALWLSIFNLDYAESRKLSSDGLPSPTGCLNCTICQYPCHPLPPPPPLSGYPSYGAPPPPAPLSGSPSYGVPPPSLPSPSGPQGSCPPFPSQCCHTYPPPNPYGYLPGESHSTSSTSILLSFSVMMLLFSFAAIF